MHLEIEAMNLEIKDRQRDLFGGFHKVVITFHMAGSDMDKSGLSVILGI
jgi:hypothetical protein